MEDDVNDTFAKVLPLAITNFENPVVVASCASFLELCGLPATMLRVDVAALCRIADYCKASEKTDSLGDWANVYGNDIASSLARELADDYMETGVTILTPKKVDVSGKHPPTRKKSRILMEVLHILEKASYTEWTRSDTSPGSWLMNGAGDGFQLRDQQREASERWSLVTTFCNTHQLPISTVYLNALARDNDWIHYFVTDALHSFAEDSGLSVNRDKTMVFNTMPHWIRRSAPTFTYGQETVEYTDAYTYLGVVFTGPRYGDLLSARMVGDVWRGSWPVSWFHRRDKSLFPIEVSLGQFGLEDTRDYSSDTGIAIMADRPDDVTEEVSSSQGQQTHEVGESSRPPQTEDEIFRTQLVTVVAMFTQVMQNPRFMVFLQPLTASQSIGNKKSEPAKAQPQVIHTVVSMETPVHLPETMQSPNPVHNAREQVAETPVLQAAPVQPATFQQPLVGPNGQGSDLQAMQQVGFLAEAQSEGCPLDVLISVASKEFTDLRLQSHILTVLKSLQSAWQRPSPSSTNLIQTESSLVPDAAASELFKILADCEHQNNSGTALLTKAKDLRWPLLAIVSSCFADVTPLSCLTVWLEITAARETSSIKVNDAAAHIAACVGAAVEATNALPQSSHIVDFQYNRKKCKRRRLMLPEKPEPEAANASSTRIEHNEKLLRSQSGPKDVALGERTSSQSKQKLQGLLGAVSSYGGTEEQESLSKMIAILSEQQRFFPLLKAFELFMPSSSLLPFIRFLQAFALMRTSEASAHLALFSNRLKEELQQAQHSHNRNGRISTVWITAAAVTAADTILTACPSAYEKRCLLQLLAGADFGDGGVAALRFRRLYWKVKLAEPAFQQKLDSTVVGTDLEDDALLLALEKQGKWEEARTWARQLELSGQNQKAVNHVTETQAEAMVAEWREFLWDLKEERIGLWSHCQSLFLKHSLPPQQAGMFFLKHAEALEQELPPSELHGILLLALQWLSGSITNTPPSYPIQQLRELETRIWLLAVESQLELQEDQGQTLPPRLVVVAAPKLNPEMIGSSPVSLDSISLTAKSVSIVDSHIKTTRAKILEASVNEREVATQARQSNMQDQSSPAVIAGANSKMKRKPRNYAQHRRAQVDKPAKLQAELESSAQLGVSPNKKSDSKVNNNFQEEVKDETVGTDDQLYWEERVGEQELERAVLSLLEVGQVSAARQLQQKLAPVHIPLELLLVETALNVARLSMSSVEGCVDLSSLHPSVHEHLISLSLINEFSSATPFEVLEALTKACREGCGRGSCKRITAVAHVSNFLELPFLEAFENEPTQLLQLLSLKAQDSLSEARLLVETHSMPAASIAKILAESYLKGLLAAHRGGYMDSSLREEGPSPLLWRPSDFLKWAELCQSEPEMGHALMRIVISGHEVPHACEVELLVRAHHFYMSSACLDGIDVLLALAATRVETYIAEGDFTSLARLVTGINNFQSLHFMLDILIENGQLELLLQKRAVVEAAMESSASVRGFRMAVLSTLKHFNPHDLDAFAMVYDQFDMKHEMAALVESRARKGLEQWLLHRDPELSDELLEMMRYNVEAAEVWASVDAGNKARWNCAQASLISLQLRIPELTWLNLNETNARRLFVEQSRFQEALVVAEAYNLNQPGEWAPVLWNQMPNPGLVDQFLSEFVAALPLPPSMLMELARFYRAEVTARGDQIDFSSWLSPGGLPHDWAKYLGKSFRCLLKYVRDMRLRVQLATLATGFPDVLDVCMRILDKVPETAGPLILRKGHGGGYLPLM
ncbi:hypothetical protein L7F22_036856 [Adiantum nelumboides]|nr:hypothetical protein [Adiantum nelumboides]